MTGGCSTSGTKFKLPGRVGDSPIIGAGLFLLPGIGAAAATGVGEEVMKVCGSFSVVQNMRRGMDPRNAIADVLTEILRTAATGTPTPTSASSHSAPMARTPASPSAPKPNSNTPSSPTAVNAW